LISRISRIFNRCRESARLVFIFYFQSAHDSGHSRNPSEPNSLALINKKKKGSSLDLGQVQLYCMAMSRPLRIEYPGAWYHVMNRGAGRKNIFRQADHRQLFQNLLMETRSAFGLEVHAYCLMDNHYHLLIHTPSGNLGRAMRHLNGVYTQRFNRSVKTDGPLFRGRYKAILVDADNYLLQVSRYIHRNPLEAGHPQWMHDPLWTSYPVYIGKKKKQDWLSTSKILKMTGSRNRSRLYRRYVEENVDDETARFYSKGRLSPVLGSEGFMAQIEKAINKQGLSPEIAEGGKIREAPSMEKIQRVCAEYFQLPPGELRTSRRSTFGLARNCAMYLSRTVGGYGLQEIANEFGSLGYSGVARAVGRLKIKIKTDRKLSQTLLKLQEIINTE
jgi:REP-associated tyrosine transposase